jgi:hypothetical protein
MSRPILFEAHYNLRRQVIFSPPDEGAQLIADSEARATAAAVATLTCTHHTDQQRAACAVCLVAALAAERDELRARAERAEVELALERSTLSGVIMLKMHFEVELAKERARLDWLESRTSTVLFRYPVGAWSISDDAEKEQNLLHEYTVVDLRVAIDAAMKEGAK